MITLMQFLVEYGVLFVFLYVLAEQAGVPIPAFPVLMAAGAVASRGALDAGSMLGAAVGACLLADTLWYLVGRRYGPRVLSLICRVSLSPEVCASRTESLFAQWGAPSLVLAKFVPGFAAIATALAGATRVRPPVFLLFAAIGGLAWAGSGLALGWVFAPLVDDVIRVLVEFGRLGAAIVVLALCGFATFKWRQRARFNAHLRMQRISVDALAGMIEAGGAPVIVDVRYATAQHDGRIPGAIPVTREAWPAALDALLRDAIIVVYCACPSDAGAAIVAARLRQRGYRNVRPLAGGIEAWRASGRALLTEGG